MYVTCAAETNYLVPRKRFKRYQVHFIRHFVPRKRFKWNQVSSMMCFVPRKRFRRNKSRNHTAPQGEVLRTYVDFHSPISRFFVHHVGRFPLTKVSRRHSPRQAGFVHHIDEKKRSGEVAPRSWRDAATPSYREKLRFNQLQNRAWKRGQK